MKRQDKYPDTSVFHYYNANPKNKITPDCVIRAISTAMHKPYATVYKELFDFSLKCSYMLNDKHCYDKYLQSMGWVKRAQPRKDDNTKYTGEEFCHMVQNNKHEYMPHIIAKIGAHHIVAIEYGIIQDIFDSSDDCIGNYWEPKTIW